MTDKKQGRIIITRADELLQKLAEETNVVAVLSIEHPYTTAGERGAAPRIDTHMQMILGFWDYEQQVDRGPNREDVAAGIAFALEHIVKGDVIIHCHAGKARSTGIALGVMRLMWPDKSEEEIIEHLLSIRGVAAPNILVVEIADEIAGRGGKLLAAVKAHERIDRQRRETEENRMHWLKKNPEMAKKLFPEQLPPGV